MAILRRESTAFVSPDVIVPLVAKSGYKKVIGKVQNIDFKSTSFVLPKIKNFGTPSSISNTWNPNAQEVNYSIGQIENPTYLIQAKYKYNLQDEANFEANINGMGMQEFQDGLIDLAMGMRVRQLVLHGFAANEGILANATKSNLTGNWSALDAGVLLSELQQHIGKLLANTKSAGREIKLMMTNRLYSYLNTLIVSTSNYLNAGSTKVVGEALKDAIEGATGKSVEILTDDTMVDSTGKEMFVMVIPDLSNDFANNDLFDIGFAKGSMTNTYLGVSEQIKKVNPEIDGYKSGLTSLVCSAGITTRSEGTYIISQAF